MTNAAVLLLLLSGRAALTAALSLNAPRDHRTDGTDRLTGNDDRTQAAAEAELPVTHRHGATSLQRVCV